LNKPDINVIIPAYNEEKSIAKVIAAIPKNIGVYEIIVTNNNSTDATEINAKNAGATVLFEKNAGYGNACLKAMAYILNKAKQPDIVVFLDGDYSDYPEEMVQLIAPILNKNADMVIGSRALGKKEKGAMTPQQIFGNWLATNLIRLFYNVKFTDLGPFRAIKWDKLQILKMQDKTYGWTCEMQVKAAKLGFNCVEVPVNYKVRIGHSKISGTIKGTILAGYKIIITSFKFIFKR